MKQSISNNFVILETQFGSRLFKFDKDPSSKLIEIPTTYNIVSVISYDNLICLDDQGNIYINHKIVNLDSHYIVDMIWVKYTRSLVLLNNQGKLLMLNLTTLFYEYIDEKIDFDVIIEIYRGFIAIFDNSIYIFCHQDNRYVLCKNIDLDPNIIIKDINNIHLHYIYFLTVDGEVYYFNYNVKNITIKYVTNNIKSFDHGELIHKGGACPGKILTNNGKILLLETNSALNLYRDLDLNNIDNIDNINSIYWANMLFVNNNRNLFRWVMGGNTYQLQRQDGKKVILYHYRKNNVKSANF